MTKHQKEAVAERRKAHAERRDNRRPKGTKPTADQIRNQARDERRKRA